MLMGNDTKGVLSAKDRKQVARFLEAFETLSKHEPATFQKIAPELLKKSIWQSRGIDPWFEERLSTWFSKDWEKHHFAEIFLTNNATNLQFGKEKTVNPRHFKGEKRDWLIALENRFSNNWTRWDVATRDQFIILTLITASPQGEFQGRLMDSLGILSTLDDSEKEASNAVRAVKIALSKLADKSGTTQLFEPAKGNGRLRLHRFFDEDLRKPTIRWLCQHPARIMLPNLRPEK
jgi:hypothetical protein